MSKILKGLAALLVLAVAAAAGGLLWLRQANSPQVEGELKLAGLSGRQKAYLQLLEEALSEIVSAEQASLASLQEKLTPGEYQVAALIRQVQPAVVLVGATAMGKDMAPRLAARLGVGLASDCTGFGVEGGRLLADFTDVDAGGVDVGTPMRMTFRIKDVDSARGFVRYFWKATPTGR